MNSIWSKIAKGLGSSLGGAIVAGLITTLFGLQVEYSAYQGTQSTKETIVIDTVHVSHIEKNGNTELNSKITPREVKLVSDTFAYSKHKWYIRLFGGVIILFPLFYFPFDDYYNAKKIELKILLQYAYDNIIGREIAKKAWANFWKEYFGMNLIYITIYIGIVFLIANYLRVSVCNYGILILERGINIVVSWF